MAERCDVWIEDKLSGHLVNADHVQSLEVERRTAGLPGLLIIKAGAASCSLHDDPRVVRNPRYPSPRELVAFIASTRARGCTGVITFADGQLRFEELFPPGGSQ
jgi:hypothetical protein